ncbi:uncharacterized protein LOC119599258 [Penaeus monodon]|uniref:uncharacterized protein LOC119599258 n=1 Tax=Penaeus monodon TaxID=6687 RepID=UPI0018A79F99|nr:uncharacterized protein LOC119599258 [Penaeus monodon]
MKKPFGRKRKPVVSNSAASNASHTPPTPKATIQPPKVLPADASPQHYLEWKREWSDYAVMVDLLSLPSPKQHIQLRMCLTPEMRRVLEHKLNVPADPTCSVDDVLRKLEEHIKNASNEALRRKAFSESKQADGECFDDFWIRLKILSQEIDLCKSQDHTCCEQWMKHGILMGIRDEELTQKLIQMDCSATLQDVLEKCRDKNAALKQKSKMRPSSPLPSKVWNCCGRQHEKGLCRATTSTTYVVLVARKAIGILLQSVLPGMPDVRSAIVSHARSVTSTARPKPQPSPKVCISIRHNDSSGSLAIIPDTGADTTVIGLKHLSSLGLSKEDLAPPAETVYYNADGSQMPPVAGSFCGTITNGDRSTTCWIDVQPSLTTPLLSWKACKDLGIVPDYFPRQMSNVHMANRVHGPDSTPVLNPSQLPPLPLDQLKLPEEARKYFPASVCRRLGEEGRLAEPTRKELESLVTQGILKPVEDEPSEWCHPMVVVPKVNGGVRITTDLSKLNRYCRGPMGFAATGNAFCLRGDRALQGVTNCIKVVDDILLHDEDYISHLQCVNEVLSRCRQHGMTLNAEKFIVAASEASFCGYKLSRYGIEADPEKVRAITEFPTPANLTDLRSFMGLVNQLAEFTPKISTTAAPLRPLMSPRRTFAWTADHTKAFIDTKQALSKPPILATFDPALPTILQTDASRLYGLGYVLLQDHGAGRYKMVQCGSRFLTDTETRYATIELEMQAVVWAISKCKFYLRGLQHFSLMTDHHPLVPILNHYSLDAIENPRLQRMKDKIAPYIFTAMWRAGKELCIPDALSRSPVSHPTVEDGTFNTEMDTSVKIAVLHAVKSVQASDAIDEQEDLFMEELRMAASKDASYEELLHNVKSGFPSDHYNLPSTLRLYWKIRNELYNDGDLVLYWT